MMNEDLYAVIWRSRLTGISGRRDDALPFADTQAAIAQAEQEHPGFLYSLERIEPKAALVPPARGAHCHTCGWRGGWSETMPMMDHDSDGVYEQFGNCCPVCYKDLDD